MSRLRPLFWLTITVAAVFAGYWLWRWRQTSAPDLLPGGPPPPPDLPPSHGPKQSLATPGSSEQPAGGSTPRRIVTRVHRGAPPPTSSRERTGSDRDRSTAGNSQSPASDRAAKIKVKTREQSATTANNETPTTTEPDAEQPVANEGEVPAEEQALEVGGTAPDQPEAPAEPAEPAAPAPGDLQPPAPGEQPRLNINSATLEELVDLPGVGKALAERILEYRDEHGSFATVDDLLAVRGIGPNLLQEFAHLVTV